MSDPRTEASYARNLTELATRAFATHAIRERGPGRWWLARLRHDGEWQATYFAEVVALAFGRLLVHGDVGAVLLATRNLTPEATVRAYAESSVGYLASHAVSDTGKLMYDTDDDVAAGTLLQRAADALEESVCDWHHDAHDGLDEESPHYALDLQWLTLLSWLARIVHEVMHPRADVVHLVEAAAHILRGDPLDEVKEALLADDVDSESLYDLGDVPAPRVFYAQAALRRLVALLDAEATS